jgi:signal peptidase I
MSVLTAVLYGALVVYLGGWYFNQWIGNFSLLLFVLTVVTLGYWLAERFWFRPARMAAVRSLETQGAQRQAELKRMGIAQADGDLEAAKASLLAQPWWLDWTAGLFPVILIVFLLRSFLFEPFKIPSGSMVPTLLVGDLILVNKYHYGVRLPVINKKIIPNNDPQPGDVVVFRYPVDPRVDYIKRVVAGPGDEVTYSNQKLAVNGKPVEVRADGEYYDEDALRYAPLYVEKLGVVEHRLLVDPKRNAYYGIEPKSFPRHENCRYSAEGVTCKVPPGHYFMMGDNRDNSQDSRYWGFVPDENIVGKAIFVWMNFSNLRRIGSFQ